LRPAVADSLPFERPFPSSISPSGERKKVNRSLEIVPLVDKAPEGYQFVTECPITALLDASFIAAERLATMSIHFNGLREKNDPEAA
jgi:hypothetical protein